jgi:hypothetical protein
MIDEKRIHEDCKIIGCACSCMLLFVAYRTTRRVIWRLAQFQNYIRATGLPTLYTKDKSKRVHAMQSNKSIRIDRNQISQSSKKQFRNALSYLLGSRKMLQEAIFLFKRIPDGSRNHLPHRRHSSRGSKCSRQLSHRGTNR